MTAAPDLSPDEAARAARFEAAPPLVESSAVVRAMLALAERLTYKDGDLKPWQGGGGPDPYEAGLDDAARDIRATLSAALAADPEPRA